MKIFKINDKIEIGCEWKKTRTAFKHEATLFFNGNAVDKTKICYQNRTWEEYKFQSVLYKIVEKTKELRPEEKELCTAFIREGHTDWSDFKRTSAIAKMGDIFCENKKDKNDWKARMLKAGLGNKGLVMPEDWDTLDEDTKQARLDKVIEFASRGR